MFWEKNVRSAVKRKKKKSILGASSYNFENKRKYHLHLLSTEGKGLIV